MGTPDPAEPSLWLARHGATAWSTSGRHTGRSDVPLTDEGVAQAEALGGRIAGVDFALVLTSPLLRARETCRLAGLGEAAVVDDDLLEWDYGDAEGRTTVEMRAEQPGWTVWTGPVVGGETVEAVGARADRVIARAVAATGTVALFAHGHVLRILAARWLGLPPVEGRRLALDAGSLSVLDHERETRVVRSWNLR